MAPARPSRRSHGEKKSYNHDPFKEHIFESASDGASEGEAAVGSGDEEDDEVMQDYEPEDDEEEEDDEFMDEMEPVEQEGEDEVGSDDEMTREESIVEVDSDAGSDVVKKKDKRSSKGTQNPAASAHSAMRAGHGRYKTRAISTGSGFKVRQRIVEEWSKGGQQARFKTFFGPTPEDLHPVLKSRDHWKSQDVLPSRAEGNLQRSFYVSQEAYEKEIKSTQEWYAEAGRKVFEERAKCRELNAQEGELYLVNDGPESLNMLMGEVKQPKLYTLNKGEFMSTSTPFPNNSTGRRGWSFFLGSSIQEIQWVPNEKGRIQYLAIAVEQKMPGQPQHKPLENPKAPAFSATTPFPASIQIWAFESKKNGELDHEKSPWLANVICTDWGAPKFFKWSPVAAVDTSEVSEEDGMIHLGLLAGVWSDGKLRILDVKFRKPINPRETMYSHHSAAAFEIEMPEAIPTCLYWLSGTSLAVASSSGNLAIWSLNRQSWGASPKPWFYKQLADTYILSLVSGYPSRPHLISITTADGFSIMYDIRSSAFDNCFAARGRALVMGQAWHEHSQSFVMADEYYLLKHSSIRRYFGNIYTMRMEAQLTCCATSLVHPCVLVGAADGTVEASNTLPKILNAKEVPWQQPWFKHEWRPPIDNFILQPQAQTQSQESPQQDTQTPTEPLSPIPNGILPPPQSSNVPADVLSAPLIRVTEGYKPHQVAITLMDDEKRHSQGVKLVTIFEEKSAVMKLAWNPNLKYGSWAAAGANSGVLRVEDLGV